jgi:two-component system OmpR family sensor kinase
MNPFKSSLYWRLLIWFCAANVLVLILGGFLSRGFIEYTTAKEINGSALAQGADQAYESGGVPALAGWSEQQRHDGIQATLYQKGEPLYPIRLLSAIEKRLPNLLDTDGDTVLQLRPGVSVAVQQVVGDDGQTRQLVAVSRTHTRLRPQTRETILLCVQLALSLLCIGLLGWWVARSVARPVEALRDATRRMAAGELSTRVGRQGGGLAHDEIGQLAYDFDAMAERIEALVGHGRSVLQDLSHELRSPLARLHLIHDLAQRSATPEEAEPYFRQAEQEIDRLDRMTGEMLILSRLESGIPGMNREQLDLIDIAHGCVAQAELEAGARNIRLQFASAGPVPVLGSALLLERALDNLIANAIKFGPEGGTVELSVRAEGKLAMLSVRDRGPGVPEAELEFLFRPFFRGSNAARADGHGMGLAIVQRVVQVHGGDIHAVNGTHGGLEVHLNLPLASAAGA